MWKILKFLFTGEWNTCQHVWEVKSTGILINEDGDRTGEWYNLQCKHCGDMKRKSLKG